MSKTHFVIVEEPVSAWPESVKALCGKTVIDPRTVMTVDIEAGELTALSTIWFCQDCRVLIMSAHPERGYIYGTLPAEEAHRANLRNRTED